MNPSALAIVTTIDKHLHNSSCLTKFINILSHVINDLVNLILSPFELDTLNK